jgi:hypothetical protein
VWALIVFVLLVGGWLGWIVRGARVQRDAVAAILNAGGSVLYDSQWENGRFIPGGKPWASQWLVDRLGVDCFGHVVFAGLSPLSAYRSPAATDAALVHLGRLGWLRELSLSGVPVTDEGLVHLKGLTRLQVLDLTGTEVTDEGLVSLEGLTGLRELSLAHALGISDAGLVYLRGLTSLRRLVPYNSRVTVAGVRSMRPALPAAQIEF